MEDVLNKDTQNFVNLWNDENLLYSDAIGHAYMRQKISDKEFEKIIPKLKRGVRQWISGEAGGGHIDYIYMITKPQKKLLVEYHVNYAMKNDPLYKGLNYEETNFLISWNKRETYNKISIKSFRNVVHLLKNYSFSVSNGFTYWNKSAFKILNLEEGKIYYEHLISTDNWTVIINDICLIFDKYSTDQTFIEKLINTIYKTDNKVYIQTDKFADFKNSITKCYRENPMKLLKYKGDKNIIICEYDVEDEDSDIKIKLNDILNEVFQVILIEIKTIQKKVNIMKQYIQYLENTLKNV